MTTVKCVRYVFATEHLDDVYSRLTKSFYVTASDHLYQSAKNFMRCYMKRASRVAKRQRGAIGKLE